MSLRIRADALQLNELACEEPPTMVEASPDQRFVRFSKEIDGDGNNRCYLALDTEKGCEVAWNVIQVPNLALDRKRSMHSQLQRMQRLEHANIVACKSAWYDDQKQVVVKITDLFRGGSLMAMLKRVKRPIRCVIRHWSSGILKALVYLHSQTPPILVKNLSTDHVFIGSDGEVKLAENGLDYSYTNLGSMSLGKEYSAPEMFVDKLTPSIDVYSFGLCLLEIVTQERPYSESPSLAQTVKRKLNQIAPKSLERVADSQVEELIELCLRPSEDRPTASELLTLGFFLEKDASLDCLPVQVRVKSMVEIPISLPVLRTDGSSAVVEFSYHPVEDTPETIALQLLDNMSLLDSQLPKIISDIRKQIAIEDSKLAVPKLARTKSFNTDRKTSLLEMEPVECSIPLCIKLILPDFPAPCKIEFSYVLNSDKPDLVADELIREFTLPPSCKTVIEDEIKRRICTKPKISVEVQTSEEELASTVPSEWSSANEEAGLSDDFSPDTSPYTSDHESSVSSRVDRDKRLNQIRTVAQKSQSKASLWS